MGKIVKCNNCGRVGNEEDLSKIFLVESVGYEASEVNKLNLNDSVSDMCDGCPNCKTDSYLTDLKNKYDLVLNALDSKEVGGNYDVDQVMRQKGFVNDCVASFVIKDSDNKYRVELVCAGEQRVHLYFDKDEEITDRDSGEIRRIHDEPNLLVKAHRLQKEREKEFVHYGDNCWINIEVFYEGKKEVLINWYDVFGSVYSSISEAISEVELEDILTALKDCTKD